jgi:hypothetical protein
VGGLGYVSALTKFFNLNIKSRKHNKWWQRLKINYINYIKEKKIKDNFFFSRCRFLSKIRKFRIFNMKLRSRQLSYPCFKEGENRNLEFKNSAPVSSPVAERIYSPVNSPGRIPSMMRGKAALELRTPDQSEVHSLRQRIQELEEELKGGKTQ